MTQSDVTDATDKAADAETDARVKAEKAEEVVSEEEAVAAESDAAAEAEAAPVESEATTDDADAEAAPAEDAAPDLSAELDAAREEIAGLKDMALRAQAEMQNVRKRAERDVENAHKFGIEKFLVSLLPVVDSLEKAIDAANEAGDNASAITEGVELCLKMLLDVMAKEAVVQVNPEGEPFDPQYHEAMSVVPSNDLEPNSVVAVIQKGYTLHGRLMRPAMVMVSKAAEQ